MEENIELLLKIIRFFEERGGDYNIENIGDGEHRLWVILGNRVPEMNTKDTEKLRALWEEIQEYWA